MTLLIDMPIAAVVLSSTMAFANPQQQPTLSSAPVGNQLTIAINPRLNLDPHWNAGNADSMLQYVLYECLYKYTKTDFALASAASVTVSPDGLTWTLKLRQNARWNDGKPVATGAYGYSLKRLVNPAIDTVYMKDYGQFLKNGLKIANRKLPLNQLGVRAMNDIPSKSRLRTSVPTSTLSCVTPHAIPCAQIWSAKMALAIKH
ncbi:MAG: ABC transporter substrate-binding protein [Treponema sp.]|jgi:ABC-type oligopeptide transport system substrate-binding subunit|nr:ABC transporter substrate-binding protein [Treponema sp.]